MQRRLSLDAAPGKLSHADLQRATLDCAAALGWTHRYHTQFSIGSEKGYPDLHLLRPPRWEGDPPREIYAELKVGRDTVKPAQQSWIDALRACGNDVFIWHPEDWFSGKIEQILR